MITRNEEIAEGIILLGIPSGEPGFSKYLLGGCLVFLDGIDPEIECIKCEWQGSKAEVRKATKTYLSESS